MKQFVDNLKQLGGRRLALLGIGVALTVAAMAYVAVGVRAVSYVPLYAGLEPNVAGEVVRRLEELNAAHKVEGDTILVDAAARDRLRMTLAQDGLPRQGQAGYELLDQLSGFGTTADMFSSAYWRAKEGELARTINSLASVREARVHLVPAERGPFRRDGAEPSASVTVTTEGGATLDRRQAQAVRHLVALAVAGLAPNRVTVIDANAGVVLASDDGSALGLHEDRQKEREAHLQREIEEMLLPYVGAGRVRVRVAVELDHESESVTERGFDPDTRVAISSDTTAIEETSNETDPAAVGVTENLPNEDAEGGAGRSSRSRSEQREVVNYEVSETLREVRKAAGAVKRLSVAVLVDGVREPAEDGTSTWRPRDERELAAIESLVRSAVGFDESRGDQLTVESLAFREVGGTAAPEESAWLAFLMRQALPLAQLLMVGVLILVALRFVKGMVPQPVPAGAEGMVGALTADDEDEPARGATPGGAALAAPGSETVAEHDNGMNMGDGDDGVAEAKEDVSQALLEAVDHNYDEAFRLICNWLNDRDRQ